MVLKEVKYRVFYTEYEAGWGSRPDGYKDFDEEEDAKKHVKEFNSFNDPLKTPDWYMVASEPKEVIL